MGFVSDDFTKLLSNVSVLSMFKMSQSKQECLGDNVGTKLISTYSIFNV